ncbi:MAG: hypothetical protein JSU96_10365 [Acidobacteriota bacterium]|nr:MAG: hypothetical protein JSU96_10365 [Acidobacteriota bacterium]
MLEKVDLGKRLTKDEYKSRIPLLRQRLYDLQKACWDHQLTSVIVFEGWDAAGKGSVINALTRRLDPRGFTLHAIQAARTYETSMPWLWRFWLRIPGEGEMAIFDRSWYGRVGVERVQHLTAKKAWRKAYRDIREFERMLTDDGQLIIKFFLHISKEEQEKRFRRMEKDPLQSFHVQPEDWEHHRKYGEYLQAYEEMFERTDSEWGPWTIIEATDRRWTRMRIFSKVVERLQEGLEVRGLELPLGKEESALESSGGKGTKSKRSKDLS